MQVNNKSAEYWEKRFEQVLVSSEMLGINYEQELTEIYEDTLILIQRELEAFYARYAIENELDLAEVKKRLDSKQLKRFKVEQKRYLNKVNSLIAQGANLESYAKTLERLSARAHVSKLQELQNNLNTLIMILTGEQEIKLSVLLNHNYLEAYSLTTFELQKGLGFGMSFTMPDTRMTEKVVKTSWNGGNYSDSIWKNKQQLTNWLNTNLPRHFAAGSGIEEMSKDLSQKLNTNYNNAVRLVRTEVNYISNQATMDSYKDSGVVKKFKILATLDSRTSEICREMDGKVFNVSESQVGVNTPPFHVRCRTTTVPYFEDTNNEDFERAARDSKGKVYYVPANITYKEWQEKYKK